jgi:metallophosphoesterase (TIGR00282 family)
MTKLLFIGDIVGEPGLRLLEERLSNLVVEHAPDFIVANAENIDITNHSPSMSNCGMTTPSINRLFALGVHVVTGGNHSWDGPEGFTIHDDPRILRPLNYGDQAPGRGATIIAGGRGATPLRLGVINVISRSALPNADAPLAALEHQLDVWQGAADLILVDFHGESVTEKLSIAFAVDGRVTALLGTHTHVPTLDTRLLPQGTAYVTDVGMTGPSCGIQGYWPNGFVNRTRLRLPTGESLRWAEGAPELGAVLLTCVGSRAVAIERIT